MKHSVLILSIDSTTAITCAEQMAADGDRVFLVSAEKLHYSVHPDITQMEADIYDPECAKALVAQIIAEAGCIDILVFAANGHKGTEKEWTEYLLDSVEYNINCCRNLIEAAFPQMKNAGMKRIAMLSEHAASITQCREPSADVAEALTQAGLHMLLRVYFNQLRCEGFTFRCYTSETSSPLDQLLSPMQYVNMKFSYDPDSPPIRNEEDRLVLRDPEFREIPW